MTHDQTATLLPLILAHPRVKAYGDGKGWYAQKQIRVCKKCGGKTKVVGLARICADLNCLSDKLTTKPSGEYYYRGPDLALDSNLHELLGLADAINGFPIDLEWVDWPDIAVIATFEEFAISGPTRTLAVLAALGRALGIES